MLVPLSGVSLPVVKHVRDCADYSVTLAPYLSELYSFPQALFANLLNFNELQEVYSSTNPCVSGLAFALLVSPLFIIGAEINKNYSQVDRFWSLLPMFYQLHYALWTRLNGLPTAKVDNVLIFSALWSARLTYNYWRKGGYSIGSEDYRWEVLRKHISPPLFALFNVVFIGFCQNVLLWAITTPTYVLLLSSQLGPDEAVGYDIVFLQILFVWLGLEFGADQQQWDYYEARSEFREKGTVREGFCREDLERGFNSRGLWAVSRHPNFLSEQAIWVSLYAWGAVSSESYLNWTLVGALGYLGLFQASTWFTELVSVGKYSDYKLYQRNVGMFLPNILNLQPGDYFKKPEAIKKAEDTVKKDAKK